MTRLDYAAWELDLNKIIQFNATKYLFRLDILIGPLQRSLLKVRVSYSSGLHMLSVLARRTVPLRIGVPSANRCIFATRPFQQQVPF